MQMGCQHTCKVVAPSKWLLVEDASTIIGSHRRIWENYTSSYCYVVWGLTRETIWQYLLLHHLSFLLPLEVACASKSGFPQDQMVQDQAH